MPGFFCEYEAPNPGIGRRIAAGTRGNGRGGERGGAVGKNCNAEYGMPSSPATRPLPRSSMPKSRTSAGRPRSLRPAEGGTAGITPTSWVRDKFVDEYPVLFCPPYIPSDNVRAFRTWGFSAILGLGA